MKMPKNMNIEIKDRERSCYRGDEEKMIKRIDCESTSGIRQ